MPLNIVTIDSSRISKILNKPTDLLTLWDIRELRSALEEWEGEYVSTIVVVIDEYGEMMDARQTIEFRQSILQKLNEYDALLDNRKKAEEALKSIQQLLTDGDTYFAQGSYVQASRGTSQL